MATCKLIPLNDNIVVRRLDSEKASKGGIIIPDSAQKKSRRGTVLAVGPGRTVESIAGHRHPPVLEPGYVVVFDQYAGSEVEIDGEAFVVMAESQVLAITKE